MVYGSVKKMAGIIVDTHLVSTLQQQHNVPASINEILERTFALINGAKKNKTHVYKFGGLMKQIVKALSGVEYNFVLQAEFYSDLKETLHKIHNHIQICTNRQKFVQLMMAKKDNQLYTDMQAQIDVLCGRIFLAYACRMATRNLLNIPGHVNKQF